MNTYKH